MWAKICNIFPNVIRPLAYGIFKKNTQQVFASKLSLRAGLVSESQLED